MPTAELPPITHPDQRPGEIYFTDCNAANPGEFTDITYQTKRPGKTVDGYFPVFVWQMEYDQLREVKIGQ